MRDQLQDVRARWVAFWLRHNRLYILVPWILMWTLGWCMSQVATGAISCMTSGCAPAGPMGGGGGGGW